MSASCGPDPRRCGESGQLAVLLQMGIFFNAGQVCSATSRLLLHKDIEQAFLAKLKARAESIKITDPLDPAARLGPIINEAQYKKVMAYIEVCIRPCGCCTASC